MIRCGALCIYNQVCYVHIGHLPVCLAHHHPAAAAPPGDHPQVDGGGHCIVEPAQNMSANIIL